MELEKKDIDPTAKAYFDMGLKFYNRGKFMEATEQWRLAVSKDPAFVDAFKYLGMAYEKLGWTFKAKKAWEQYVKLTKDPATKAMVQEHLKKLDGR